MGAMKALGLLIYCIVFTRIVLWYGLRAVETPLLSLLCLLCIEAGRRCRGQDGCRRTGRP
jgi:hypothetical protein